jgi:O-antigen/teichoic acid export membrane protein
MVPLTINYLNTKNYGLWLTITSFIGWFSFFDIGIGNGLRNKFAEAKALNKLDLLRSYISSAYFSISGICFILTLILFIVNNFVDWTSVFNTDRNLQDELKILMYFVILFFNLQLIAKLITTIYMADQKSSKEGLIQFIIQSSSLVLIWVLTKIIPGSLLIFGVVFSGIPVFVLLIFSIISFRTEYRDISPVFFLVQKSHLKDIFSIGLGFFLIQISCLVLYTTSNMIITHLFGSEYVTPYNIAYKYFSISYIVFTIVITPYWSAITEAYSKGDYAWIKGSIRNLRNLSFSAIGFLLFMFFVSNKMYYLWVGSEIRVPNLLSMLMCIYFMIIIFMQPYIFFINGTGKIKIQLIVTTLGAIINIPLSILLGKYCGLGISGIILSTIICTFPGIFYAPIQYRKIINKNASGLWNQ